MFYCFIDQTFFATMHKHLLEFAIAHATGASSPTLYSALNYPSLIKPLGNNRHINLFINIDTIAQMFAKDDTTGETKTIIQNLGLDNASSLSASALLAPKPGYSLHAKTLVKLKGPKTAVLKMLDLKSAPINIPAFIPASAYSATVVNIDFSQFYDTLAQIVTKFNPMFAAVLYAPLTPPAPDGSPGINLKTNIIDHLGDQVIYAQNIIKPFSKEQLPNDSLLAVATVNRFELEKSLDTIHSTFIARSNPNLKRELLGYNIYLIDISAFLPFLFGGQPSAMNQQLQNPPTPDVSQFKPPVLAFTVTDTHLIFGLQSTVEQAVRTIKAGTAESILSQKWFNRAKAVLPPAAGITAIQHDQASAELMWWTFKNIFAQQQKLQPANADISPKALEKMVDFSLLPEFDLVKKYFGISVSYGNSIPEGFFFDFIEFNPK